VKDAASDLTAAGDRGLDSGDDNRRAHPLGDRIADDPVREAVLDGAEVKLVLVGAVLGDVGEPQPVRGRGVELAADQVVMSRSGTMSSASLASPDSPS
jgi:hypothetical protein